MRGVAAFAALLAASVLASPAQARMHAGPGQLSAGHRLQGVIAPLDGGGSFSTPAGAYSLRRLKSTYAGPAIKLRRASDSATQDISFLGFTGFTGAPIDTAAAAAFCASTTCFIVTWYDQGGNGQDVTHPTAANQPAFIFNCSGAQPCIRTNLGSQYLFSSSQTPNIKMSFGVMAKVTGTGCYWLTNTLNNNQLISDLNGPGGWVVQDTGTYIYAAAANAVWHAGLANIDGAASVLRVDDTETTGTIAGNATAGVRYAIAFASAGTTCDATELLLWQGYALTAGERAALTANQRAWMGLP